MPVQATEWTHSIPFRLGDGSLLVFMNGRFVLGRSLLSGFSSEDGLTWTSHGDEQWRRQLAYPERLFTLNGQAYGLYGAHIFKSGDGIVWSREEAPLKCSFGDLTWGQGKFVAVGGCSEGMAVVTSTDGVQWEKFKPALPDFYHRILHGGNRFVMFNKGGIAASTDAVNWSLAHKVEWANQQVGLSDIAYGNGRFVAVGDGRHVFTSPDAAIWAESTMTEGGDLRVVIFADNRFVAVDRQGMAHASADGLTWRGVDTKVRQALRIAHGSGRYLVSGLDGDVAVSEDGAASWTYVPHHAGILKGAVHARETFAAVGDSGVIATSSDGTRWTARTSGTPRGLNGIAWGKDIAVAVGDSGTILTSPDFFRWTKRDGGTTADIDAIVFGGSVFVATGSGSTAGRILASHDGIAWETAYESESDRSIRHVAFGDGMFFALSSSSVGTVLTSPDGLTWNRRQFGSMNKFFGNFVAHGKAGFLFGASFDNDTIYLSKDGMTVEPIRIPALQDVYGAYNVRSMAYGHGYYVAAKNNTRNLMYSSEGKNWFQDTSDFSENCSIHFLGGKWLKLCNDKTTSVTSGFDVLAILARPNRPGLVPRALRLPPGGLYLPSSLLGLRLGLEIFDASGRMMSRKDILVRHLPLKIDATSAAGAYYIRLHQPWLTRE